MALGIGDDAALVAWLADNPTGTEGLGRVLVAELRNFLKNPPQLAATETVEE